MKGRRPTRGELALWRKVARTARPAPNANTRKGPVEDAPPAPDRVEAEAPPPDQPARDGIAPFRIGERAGAARATATAAPPARQAPRMDRKAFQRLVRGQMKPEARLDLHGKTRDEAHAALTAFILSSHARGRRLVLVITGKGRGSVAEWPAPAQGGVLQRMVPLWLGQGAMRRVVLEVTSAHRRHGGEGAYYVYLRRPERT